MCLPARPASENPPAFRPGPLPGAGPVRLYSAPHGFPLPALR